MSKLRHVLSVSNYLESSHLYSPRLLKLSLLLFKPKSHQSIQRTNCNVTFICDACILFSLKPVTYRCMFLYLCFELQPLHLLLYAFRCNSFQFDSETYSADKRRKGLHYLFCLGWNRGRLLTKQSNFPAQRQRESNLSSAHESRAGRLRLGLKMGRKPLFAAEAPPSICCSKEVKKCEGRFKHCQSLWRLLGRQRLPASQHHVVKLERLRERLRTKE